MSDTQATKGQYGMKTFLSYPLIALAALLLSIGSPGYLAHAAGGNATAQTVGLYRATCAASVSGPVVGTARFQADDQGGIRGGAEIRVGVTDGLTRATYSVTVLTGDCQILQRSGSLITDDSGRGDLDVHVSGTTIPSGASLRVTLSAPGDTLTSEAVPAP